MNPTIIKLTNVFRGAFYVNAFAIDMIEPCGKNTSHIHMAGQVRECRESPDEIKRLIDEAKADWLGIAGLVRERKG